MNAQFPETLRVGVRGNPVRILQHRLRLIAAFYSTIPAPDADGIFGEGTREAVSAFQNRFGLSPDGVVGAATWSEIYRIYREIIDAELLLEREELPLVYGGELLRVGSRGERVQALQNYLNTVRTVWQEIPLLPETGYFGDETRNAVRIFQQVANLTPDGVVGKETWDTLTALYTDIRTGLGRSTGQYLGRTLRQEREEN